MTIAHFGKREPGGLTAASPGDTLFFAFATYNDSGDSEALVGLNVADIEVFKNGLATTRATDSGYSLISDTGMLGDRAGLYRFSVQLFNTADDTGHYESGAWYQVAVDSILVDGKTVRMWVGSFEIGRQKVNAVEIDSDTGAADVLAKFAGTGGTLSPTGELDTGSVANNSYLPANVVRLVGDTGAADRLQKTFIGGFADTGINDRLTKIEADTGINSRLLQQDTGAVANAVWGFATRSLTAFPHDTGVADTVWKYSDTGVRRVHATMLSDTGINSRFSQQDTGAVAAAVWGFAARALTAFAHDTGVADTTWKYAGRKLAVDTGIAEEVWRYSDTGARRVHTTMFSDTGVNDRLAKILADTDTGIQSGVHVTSFSDTGVNNRLAEIRADTDTGIQSSVNVTSFSDTGVNERLDAIETKTNSLTFTVAGQVDSNVQAVNDTQVAGTGASGNEWRPA